MPQEHPTSKAASTVPFAQNLTDKVFLNIISCQIREDDESESKVEAAKADSQTPTLLRVAAPLTSINDAEEKAQRSDEIESQAETMLDLISTGL